MVYFISPQNYIFFLTYANIMPENVTICHKNALWRVPQGEDEKLYTTGVMLGLWLHCENLCRRMYHIIETLGNFIPIKIARSHNN